MALDDLPLQPPPPTTSPPALERLVSKWEGLWGVALECKDGKVLAIIEHAVRRRIDTALLGEYETMAKKLVEAYPSIGSVVAIQERIVSGKAEKLFPQGRLYIVETGNADVLIFDVNGKLLFNLWAYVEGPMGVWLKDEFKRFCSRTVLTLQDQQRPFLFPADEQFARVLVKYAIGQQVLATDDRATLGDASQETWDGLSDALSPATWKFDPAEAKKHVEERYKWSEKLLLERAWPLDLGSELSEKTGVKGFLAVPTESRNIIWFNDKGEEFLNTREVYQRETKNPASIKNFVWTKRDSVKILEQNWEFVVRVLKLKEISPGDYRDPDPIFFRLLYGYMLSGPVSKLKP